MSVKRFWPRQEIRVPAEFGTRLADSFAVGEQHCTNIDVSRDGEVTVVVGTTKYLFTAFGVLESAFPPVPARTPPTDDEPHHRILDSEPPSDARPEHRVTQPLEQQPQRPASKKGSKP